MYDTTITTGRVLGAVTGLTAGAAILPRTGVGSLVFYLVLISMAAAALVLISFVVARLIRAIF